MINVPKTVHGRVQDDPKVQQWFTLFDLSYGTQETYTIYLGEFCKCIGKNPTELIEEAIDETKAGLLLSERNTAGYLTRFKKCLKDKGSSPKTTATAVACVRSFYKGFDIQLSASIGRVKKALPQRENQTFLTKTDVKKLVANAKNLRDRAIILCMASSGMARQEILNLRLRDVRFERIDTLDRLDGSGVSDAPVNNSPNENWSEIGVVSIRRQKSQVDYISFISPEAVTALHNYLDERGRSDKLQVRGQNDFVFVTYRQEKNGDSVKRIEEETFTNIFRTLGAQLGYSNGGYQVKSKSHALRKYFSTLLQTAGMPKNYIDSMLGHAPSTNDLAYFKQDKESLKKLYVQYLPYLIFEKNIEVRSLDTKDARRLAELEKENETFKKQFNQFMKNFGVRQLPNGNFEFEAELRQLPEHMQKKHSKKFALVIV